MSPANRKPVAELVCTMSDGEVRKASIPVRVGRTLSSEGLPLPLDEDDAWTRIYETAERACFSMLTELLARRDYSTHEMRAKLLAHGFRDREIDVALRRAIDMRFLDDGRFAGYFIEERKRRGWGRRKIEVELKRRGIEVESVSGYPEAFFSDEDDIERARAILERKTVPSTRAFEKLVRHLMSKGFSYSISADVARERLEDMRLGDPTQR